ncbi:glycosyltransferase, partial [Priestia megaterium]
EIGLAKELDKLFNEIVIYKLIPRTEKFLSEKVTGCNRTTLNLIPARKLGNNGFFDVDRMDKNIDVLVYFCDTQLMVTKVHQWCKKNKIKFVPYIGVVESHSNNKIKKAIINKMFSRNIAIYKKCTCMVKTPEVKVKLQQHDVTNCRIAPVGLDLSIMHTEYSETSVSGIKKRWGFENNDRVLLFIGRLVPEKQPIKLIEIFEQIYKRDPSYKLLIVGTGDLRNEIESQISRKHLRGSVKIVDKVPNRDIWELYKISKAFINLNQKEIFGMAILEAMYYKCKVVAWEAPGPNFIIEDGLNGVLCKSNIEIIDAVMTNDDEIGIASHNRVINEFTWKKTAKVLYEIVKENSMEMTC